tara:strand:- start:5242 stop:5721 length:480 start_codon:yes stop_codon:yes gene_type:complete
MTTRARVTAGTPTGGQFAAHTRQSAEIVLEAPLNAESDPTGQMRAEQGMPGTWGATPEHWTRVDRAAAALIAPPSRTLGRDEQSGWDSLDGIENTIDIGVQPESWTAWKIGESLRITRQAAAHDTGMPAGYWDGRISRLTQIKDTMFGLADEAAVAAEH